LEGLGGVLCSLIDDNFFALLAKEIIM